MKKSINNFCGGAPISIESNVHPEIGPLVSIIQRSGALSFHHSLTPDGAREMAEALMEVANSMDEVTV
jgi:hypothetical protein